MRSKGQSAILEFVLVSFLGIVFVVVVLSLLTVVEKKVYRYNFELQARNIAEKLWLYEHIFIYSNYTNGSLSFALPPDINGKSYLVVFNGHTLNIKNEDGFYFNKENMPCYHNRIYIASNVPSITLIKTQESVKCDYRVG